MVITDTTAGATIYYTTNGSYPSQSSSAYSGPIPVSSSEIVVAVAVAPGYTDSSFASAEYLISSVPARFAYTIAGNQAYGYGGDGGPATSALLNSPNMAVADSQGNVYIADSSNNLVRMINATTGIITTIAGTGAAAESGDGGPATSAALNNPGWLALDNFGNLFIGDQSGYVVRKLVLSTGIISTYAGNPSGTGTNSGPATNISLSYLTGLSCDASGNLYIGTGSAILKVDTTGNTTELAGLDDMPNFPASTYSFAIDASQNIYLYSTAYRAIYKIDPARDLTVYAGYENPPGGDGGPATKAGFGESGVDLAVDSAGNVYAADTGDGAIREINAQTGIINTIAGVFFSDYAVGGGGDPATSSALLPGPISLDQKGNIYVADYVDSLIWLITAPSTPPSTPTATPAFSPSQGTYATPQALTISASTVGSAIYFTHDGTAPMTNQQGYHGQFNLTGSAQIQAIAVAPGFLKSAVASASYTVTQPPAAIISTVAGNGTDGFSGAGGAATSAQLAGPSAVAVGPSGSLYIADPQNNLVWSVNSGGTISIAAGTGTSGFSGDGGAATSAQLASPTGVAVDKSGNLHIADSNNNRVREVTLATGMINTIAGPGVCPTYGDGGPATSACLANPQALAFDSLGNLYIADTFNGRVRMVATNTGTITTVAGSSPGYLSPGDGGPATSADLSPVAIALDAANNLYIADGFHSSIREVNESTGIISTIAGGGILYDDGVPATKAVIAPYGVGVDTKGTVFIADVNRVRSIQSDGTLSTVAGTGYFGYNGDGGSATMADINTAGQLTFDQSGNLYVPDLDSAVVRKVTFPPPAATPTLSLASGTYTGAQTVTLTDATQNATIYYTTDGTAPNTGSSVYSGAITVSQSETLQAIAVSSGYAESAIASASYSINLLTPTVSLGSSANAAFLKNNLTFTASVSSSNGNPTGTVNFFDGATNLGAGTISSGTASLTTASLAAGSHSITAVYSGDALFTSVTSSAISVTIEDFTIAPATGTSSAASVSSGGTAAFTMTVAPSGANSTPADIALSVSGLPSGASATFNPTKVAAGSGSTNVALTISVPASTSASNQVRPNIGLLPLLSLIAMPWLVLRKVRNRLSRNGVFFTALLGALCFSAICACGGGGGGNGGGGNSTSPQSYALTVTGSSGALSHTTTLTLTVQ